jgi:hypothetical protein
LHTAKVGELLVPSNTDPWPEVLTAGKYAQDPPAKGVGTECRLVREEKTQKRA